MLMTYDTSRSFDQDPALRGAGADDEREPGLYRGMIETLGWPVGLAMATVYAVAAVVNWPRDRYYEHQLDKQLRDLQ